MTPLFYKEIMQLVYFIYSVILPGGAGQVPVEP